VCRSACRSGETVYEISGQVCTAGWGLTFVAVVDAILLDDRLFAV
jgi:hypothetical protein